MKKYLAFSAALCCAPVLAQSSSNVTVYGVIDQGVRRAIGMTPSGAPLAGSVNALNSGVDSTSRWGIRGREDLGGGLSASFALESGLAADEGNPLNATKYFDRASWLGLSGNWGRVTAGRQTTLLADAVIATDPLGLRFASLNPNIATTALSAHGLGIQFGPAGSTAGSYRLDNSLKYANTFGRVTASAMYGFGEVNGSGSASSSKGAGLSFSQDALTLSGAYQTFRAADSRALDGYALGATYRVGPVRLAAGAGRNVADTSATAKTTQRVYSVGATWAVTAVVDLTTAYYKVDRSRTAAASDGYGRLITFGEYKLSKRSKLFAEIDVTNWRNGYQGKGIGSRATGFTVGISHNF
ncbi:MAG: porin [Pseudomonadota bacterium]